MVMRTRTFLLTALLVLLPLALTACGGGGGY
jgi:predicted small secreted protein